MQQVHVRLYALPLPFAHEHEPADLHEVGPFVLAGELAPDTAAEGLEFRRDHVALLAVDLGYLCVALLVGKFYKHGPLFGETACGVGLYELAGDALVFTAVCILDHFDLIVRFICLYSFVLCLRTKKKETGINI